MNEQWCVMFVIVVGSIMTAYLVGKVTSLIFEGDNEDLYLREKMDEAYAFCTHYQLSSSMIRAITAHIEYSCQYNYNASEDSNAFLKSLPNHLRTKVEKQIASRSIHRLDFLTELNDAIIGNIRISLKSIGCNAGCKVFVEGERSTDLYLVRIGCARLYFGQNDVNKDKKSRLLKRGDVCGEFCIINPVRSSTLVCETWCEFYTVKAEIIKEIIHERMSPKKANEAWENIKNILQSTRDKFRHVIRDESDKLLKFKAKNDVSDTVYDDLFSADHHKDNFGFLGMQEETISSKRNVSASFIKRNTNENEDEVGDASNVVDRMRHVSRVDSGLKDFKLKKHLKDMHNKNGMKRNSNPDIIELESFNEK